MRIHPFHLFEEKKPHPLPNYWGYAPFHFFSLMQPYGTPYDLKCMVKACHQAGIEVILDVVYNHTSASCSLKGIDHASYYLHQKEKELNFSGCGNTLSCNHPATRQLILDSLRYFAEEFKIDGFRFDLASVLTRGEDGKPLQSPPLLQEMEKDPILSKLKLIAEPWDAAGLYQLGSFPSQCFGEWNGKFRDEVRKYLRGDGPQGKMKLCMRGSPDLYSKASKSWNFVTIHDGFTLLDLVSYNEKHNEANLEENQDGSNENFSWNCGTEGVTESAQINHLRKRQMKNFLVALLTANGIPMIQMGDEYGHTKLGNNNTWCHDSPLNYFDWNQPSGAPFINRLIKVRKQLLLPFDSIEELPLPFLAFCINQKVIVAFNPTKRSYPWPFPEGIWKLILDTDEKEQSIGRAFQIHPYSSQIMIKAEDPFDL